MDVDLSRARLPKVYKRNGQDCYLDPIRKKLIYITPEETVRQRVISYLLRALKVPENMIFVEDRLSHYGLQTRDRADIIVCALAQDGMQHPLAVIECKAESVYLDERAFEQAQRYSDALGSVYTMLTNGAQTFVYKYDERENKYIQIKSLPKYRQMLEGKYIEQPVGSPPPRIAYEKLADELRASFAAAGDNYYLTDISSATPFEMALALFNFEEGLLDERVKMPTGDYGLFRLMEDYGVRNLTYGNGGGGQFNGLYRSFLVEVDGNTEFYSIGLATYWKSSWDRAEKPPQTAICVGHDDEETSHHALQLTEDSLVLTGKTLRFYHNGRIAVGRMGSGKKSGLMELVSKRYPKIIHGDGYYLGSLTADHLLRLDEADMIELVVSLISYSIVRDEYRRIVKSAKSE